MPTDTATVTTLTAEVRVLMVGSRQVTISVYNQLDWAFWPEIEAMGRINNKERRLEVIGRRKTDNSLVRCSAISRYVSFAECLKSFREPLMVRDGLYNVEGIREFDGVNELCWTEYSTERTRRLLTDAEWIIAERYNAEELEKRAVYKIANNLPLIVLAGLR